LFLTSGRDWPIDLVVIDRKTRMAVPRDTDALIAALVKAQIDVMFLDPFISCHSVPENLNEAIEKVAQQLNLVAEKADVAIHVAHHSVKKRGEDVGAMDYRGGGAALAKLRYVQTINRMTTGEAKKLGIGEDEAWKYIRVDGDKPNLAPPDKARWYFMESVSLGNGAEPDIIGVARPWKYELTGKSVADWQDAEIDAVCKALGARQWAQLDHGKEWIGIPLAAALGIDLTEAAGKAETKELIKELRSLNIVKLVSATDKSRNKVKRLQLDAAALRGLFVLTEFPLE
jgi:hypothetical protein